MPRALASKAKVPHAEGLPCLSCGALEASQWRGPAKRYCSKGKCKKAATAALHGPKASASEEKLKEMADDIETLEATLESRSARYEERLAEQAQSRRRNSPSSRRISRPCRHSSHGSAGPCTRCRRHSQAPARRGQHWVCCTRSHAISTPNAANTKSRRKKTINQRMVSPRLWWRDRVMG